ncbi:pyruvate kinase [Bacilliculturomica massiliensis]|uniref:pyruvate kinase n=1 Tax=Bacilliculturomica massiliensis TaxID=1917867 RepID=UPI001FE2B65B|nr:pyruvate kinase [Bacilliculturomica massiliensis]
MNMNMSMRKTKIICTIGPASANRKTLKELMLAGMNVARLNFSHGSYEEHLEKIDLIKEVRQELGLHVAIMLDTKGPEIRTGTFEQEEVELQEGQEFTLTSRDVQGTDRICSVSYKHLAEDVEKGSCILIDDGLIELEVKSVEGEDIHCIVKNSGVVKDHKGINVPGTKVNLPAITERDKADIRFGVENGIDALAASFVRKASDVEAIRQVLAECGGRDVFVISKIENKEGVDNVVEIIAASDGIMVARGDLGVEIPVEEVPIIQKKIIRRCNFEGKTVITATQMLDSMIRNPRPTRAEVTDVANAILDGTDVIMLSGETASGKYPVEAVETMVNIALTAEKAIPYDEIVRDRSYMRDYSVTNAIGHATCTSAHGLKATAILTPTSSGHTAFVVAQFKPQAPIIAFTDKTSVARRLCLCWGTWPLLIGKSEHERQIFEDAIAMAKGRGLIKDGDTIVITAGVPVLKGGNTNMMRINIVGQEL